MSDDAPLTQSRPSGLMPGTLYVVATPIGNLSDLSPRAAQVLAAADLVAAEDTRTTRPLIARVGGRARLVAAHQHNEMQAAAAVVQALQEGRVVALVSDAGTPAVSDPGARIVSAVLAAGITVVPVPGPSALTAMLSVCGMVQGPFRFEGFLPSRATARRDRLAVLSASDCPWVIFEAPHRIAQTLEAIRQVCGDERWLAIGRELTKKFEEVTRLQAGQAQQWLDQTPMRERGEFVVVVAQADWFPGRLSDADSRDTVTSPVSDALSAEQVSQAQGQLAVNVTVDALVEAALDYLPASRAARLVEHITGQPHRAIYARTLLLAGKRKSGAE
ncbi:MAG: hypothetical protein RI906_2961 [Pseudomonadota bacterium]|jgi:16S rRNA (cytidine1402-2'-O)-methyltransferase